MSDDPNFGWQGDVGDEEPADEAGEPYAGSEEEAGVPFASALERARKDKELKSIGVGEYKEALPEVEDVDLLKKVWLADDREQVRGYVRQRLHDLDAVAPENEESEQAALDEVGSGGADSSNGDETDSPSEGESDSEPDFGGTPSTNAPGDEESESEPENAESEESGGAEDPFAHLGGDSIDSTTAQELEHRKRVMVWGPPGVGKTHFAFSSEEPLAIIDTEGKAHDLAEKFPDKTLRIWQPDGYEQAREHLHQAMKWLQAWLDERDKRGTLIVDSMSIMWEWSKTHYIEKHYIEPDSTGKYESPTDVDLKSGLQSNDPDWPKIKEYHNRKFRQPMVQSPFHLVWTAMATEDFAEKIERDISVTPDKPAGEKENVFKVNYILHVREDDSGVPFGDLEKSGITKHTFAGLEWPTAPKMFDVIQDIKDAELSDESVPIDQITDEDVQILAGKPSRLRGVGTEEETD